MNVRLDIPLRSEGLNRVAYSPLWNLPNRPDNRQRAEVDQKGEGCAFFLGKLHFFQEPLESSRKPWHELLGTLSQSSEIIIVQSGLGFISLRSIPAEGF